MMDREQTPRDEYGQRRYESLLAGLVDRNAVANDPWYHTQIAMFRNWLRATEAAMEDEDVERRVIERVLNRIVYATPSGADAYERIERQRLDLEAIRQMPGLFGASGVPYRRP